MTRIELYEIEQGSIDRSVYRALFVACHHMLDFTNSPKGKYLNLFQMKKQAVDPRALIWWQRLLERNMYRPQEKGKKTVSDLLASDKLVSQMRIFIQPNEVPTNLFNHELLQHNHVKTLFFRSSRQFLLISRGKGFSSRSKCSMGNLMGEQ